MSAKARRKITVTYSNDVEGETELNAGENADSPASVQLVALAAPAMVDDAWTETDVEVTVPEGATGVTILKDGANEAPVRFRGDTGNESNGFLLHPTDPDSFSLDSSVSSFFLANAWPESDYINAAATTVRLFWT